MRLNAFTDYGFRVLMRDLSDEFGISRHHLTKVIATMAHAGFVATRRGHGGGIRLARPAQSISLGEVVRVMEQNTALVECFRADGGHCTLSPGCLLCGHLSAARQVFLEYLDRTTIADCAYSVALGPAPGTEPRSNHNQAKRRMVF